MTKGLTILGSFASQLHLQGTEAPAHNRHKDHNQLFKTAMLADDHS